MLVCIIKSKRLTSGVQDEMVDVALCGKSVFKQLRTTEAGLRHVPPCHDVCPDCHAMLDVPKPLSVPSVERVYTVSFVSEQTGLDIRLVALKATRIVYRREETRGFPKMGFNVA